MQCTESGMFLGVSLALLLSLGCVVNGGGGEDDTTTETAGDGDGDGDGGDGDGDGGDGDGDGGDGDGDGGDGDGDPIMCPGQFPMFDKSCADTNECVIAMHTTDCCGSEAAIGINANELPAFEAAEATCDGQYPECDCAPMPTSTEDGNSTQDPSVIAVECVDGSCTTSVP